MISLTRVIVNHIKNDFEAVTVQCAHHAFELIDGCLRIGVRGKTHVGCEERQCIVAPIIGQLAINKESFVDVVMNGHQLDRRNAQ